MNEEILERITRRRKQMIVHSIIYYDLGESIISDKTFDKWAYELRDLQQQYPLESENAPYYDLFKDWTGATGYHLVQGQIEFRLIAINLLRYKTQKELGI